MEHHGWDVFGQYPLKRMLDSAIDLVYPNGQMQEPNTGNSTASALISSAGWLASEIASSYQFGYKYYRDSRYLPLIRNAAPSLLPSTHGGPPSLPLTLPVGPGVLTAASFDNIAGSATSEEIFTWLLQNNFFRETYNKYNTQADVVLVTATMKTALEKEYPTQAAGILGVLQTALAQIPAPAVVNENYFIDGYGVLREPSAQGASNGINQLLVEYGSNVKSHGQPNGMAIDLFAQNEPLAPLPGDLYPYNNNPIDPNWYWTTVASNTLVIDELSQIGSQSNVYDSRTEAVPNVNQVVFGYSSTMGLEKVSSNSLYTGVNEDRAVFMTSNYIADIFGAFSDTPHTYDLPWHFIGTADTHLGFVNGSTANLTAKGYNSLTDVTHAYTNGEWYSAITMPNGVVAYFWAAPNDGVEIISADGTEWLLNASKESSDMPVLLERESSVNNAVYGNAIDVSGSKYVTGITKEEITNADGAGSLLRIKHGTAADYAFSAFAPGTYTSADKSFTTDAWQAMVVYGASGLQGVFLGGGTRLSTPEVSLTRTDADLSSSGLVALEYNATTGQWTLTNNSNVNTTIHVVLPCAGINKTISLNRDASITL